jgi:hypothetical protein
VSTGEEAQPRATNAAIAHMAIDHDLEDLRRLMRRSMQLGRRQQSYGHAWNLPIVPNSVTKRN